MSSLHLRLHLVGLMDTPPPTPVPSEDEESHHSKADDMEMDEEGEGQEEEANEEPSEGVVPRDNPEASLPPSQGQNPAEGATVDTTLPAGAELPREEDNILLDGDDGCTITTGSDAPPAEFSGDLERAKVDSPSAPQ